MERFVEIPYREVQASTYVEVDTSTLESGSGVIVCKATGTIRHWLLGEVKHLNIVPDKWWQMSVLVQFSAN